MIIDLQIVWCPNNSLKHIFAFDDVTGIVTPVGTGDPTDFPPILICYSIGDLVYSDVNWRVYIEEVVEYSIMTLRVEPTQNCSAVIDSIITTPDIDGTHNGTITVNAHSDTTVEWSLDGLTYSTDPLVNLAAGTYYVYVKEVDNIDCNYIYQIVTIESASALAANINGTNVTYAGGNDGTLYIQITGGTVVGGIGSFSLQPNWEAPPAVSVNGTLPLFALSRTGLLADTYTVLITDLNSGATLTLSITLTEPAVVPPPPPTVSTTGDFLFAPILNPVKFVEEAVIDNCSVFQTMDNTLFCKQVYPGFKCGNYLQKVAKCDVLTIQFQSNYIDSAHAITLRDWRTDEVVKTYYAVTKETNLNQAETFAITIALHEAGKSRIYFNTGTIPIPLAVADVFTISNNADGFNGDYAITAIQNDVLLGAQYLVITKDYAIGEPSSSADGTFINDLVGFNVLEFLVNNLGSVSDGDYYFKIVATSDEEVKTIVSEPIELAEAHEGTCLIEYRNFDNAFDMTWVTGITCKIRVEATLFEAFPGGSVTTTRNTDETLVKLQAKKRRQFKLYLWDLPPYMIEKLSIIFDCDYWAINKVQYQSEDELEDARYRTRYPLASTQIKIEQVGWFRKNNSDDLGNVDVETGFIIANGGFLKR